MGAFGKKARRYVKAAAKAVRTGDYEKLMEQWYYKKLLGMMPEIELYKVQTREHILNRAKEVNCANMREYVRFFSRNEAERRYLRQNLTLTGTHFFRGNDWEYFIAECLCAFAERDEEQPVRIWCAGCSSGQEAYSVIMGLMDYVPVERIRLLATDYNEEMLEKTRAASYFRMHYEEIPERYRQYFTFDAEGKKFSPLPEIRAAVETERLDLLTDEYPSGFDVILCRNVLKFFHPTQIPLVQAKLAASLSPGGFLFTATDDHHNGRELISDPASMGLVQLDGRCIYRKKA